VRVGAEAKESDGSEKLTEMQTERDKFCDISGGDSSERGLLIGAYGCFGGIYCLRLQGCVSVGYYGMVSVRSRTRHVLCI
jgi:hypothetical protein